MAAFWGDDNACNVSCMYIIIQTNNLTCREVQVLYVCISLLFKQII